MNKNTTPFTSSLLGQLSKVFVTELLGLDPRHHQLTQDAAWIHLAERLLRDNRNVRVNHQHRVQAGR